MKRSLKGTSKGIAVPKDNWIRVFGAREHNLKSVNVSIPKYTVFFVIMLFYQGNFNYRSWYFNCSDWTCQCYPRQNMQSAGSFTLHTK